MSPCLIVGSAWAWPHVASTPALAGVLSLSSTRRMTSKVQSEFALPNAIVSFQPYQPWTIEAPSTLMAMGASGLAAGPLTTEPSLMLNLLP